MHFYFLLGLGRSVFNGTHQLTNNSTCSLIQILEDIHLTHELLKGRDSRDGLLDHLDEMDWMELMDRKETREREETLE